MNGNGGGCPGSTRKSVQLADVAPEHGQPASTARTKTGIVGRLRHHSEHEPVGSPGTAACRSSLWPQQVLAATGSAKPSKALAGSEALQVRS